MQQNWACAIVLLPGTLSLAAFSEKEEEVARVGVQA